jgi:hypothetical protein
VGVRGCWGNLQCFACALSALLFICFVNARNVVEACRNTVEGPCANALVLSAELTRVSLEVFCNLYWYDLPDILTMGFQSCAMSNQHSSISCSPSGLGSSIGCGHTQHKGTSSMAQVKGTQYDLLPGLNISGNSLYMKP